MKSNTNFLIVIIIFTVGVIAFGNLRPSAQECSGVPGELFLRYKLNQKAKNHMLFAGDSRTESNIAVSEISKIFDDKLKMFNLGFSGQPLDKEFLDFITLCLTSDKNETHIIVLEVAPSNLRTGPKFTFKANDHVIFDALYYYSNYYDSISPDEVKRLIHRNYVPDAAPQLYADGWRATTINNRNGKYKGLVFTETWEQRKKILTLVASYVENWKKDRIIIFCYQPPTTEKNMRDAANSGYDQDYVRTQLQQAGAIWLDVPQTKYYCYDDSHLEKQAAIDFSHDIGLMIKEKLAELGKLPTQ